MQRHLQISHGKSMGEENSEDVRSISVCLSVPLGRKCNLRTATAYGH